MQSPVISLPEGNSVLRGDDIVGNLREVTRTIVVFGCKMPGDIPVSWEVLEIPIPITRLVG